MNNSLVFFFKCVARRAVGQGTQNTKSDEDDERGEESQVNRFHIFARTNYVNCLTDVLVSGWMHFARSSRAEANVRIRCNLVTPECGAAVLVQEPLKQIATAGPIVFAAA